MPPLESQRYDRVARLLHWLLAALLIAQLAFGWWLDEIPRNTPARGYFINLHKSVGLVLGLLVLVRLGWRLGHKPPALPAATPAWQRQISGITHGLLYALMLIVPTSGYLASNFSKHGINFFNSIKLAPWGVDNREIYSLFNQTHKLSVALLVGLIVIHVGAALWHGLRRDGVLSRMGLRPF